MTAIVKKWGNSAAVRIPAAVLAEARMKVNQPVSIREERGRIVIEAVRGKAFQIDALVKGIRPGNLHESVDTGPPMGREDW